MSVTKMEALKALGTKLGADMAHCVTHADAINCISEALGCAERARTSTGALDNLCDVAAAAMEQKVELNPGWVSPGSSITSVAVPDGVTHVNPGAFNDFSAVESVTFPDSVIFVNAGMFDKKTSLKSVTLSANLDEIYPATFNGCTALQSITLPEKIKSIGSMAFAGCTALTEIEIPASVTTISNCFNGSGITKINIHKPENSISGAPWGATNAQVNWLG